MGEKLIELIKKIKISTKDRTITWGRVSDLFSSHEIGNNLLRQYILLNERGAYFYNKRNNVFSLSQCQSFYTEIEHGYVCIFKYVRNDSSYYIVGIQPNKNASVIELNNKGDMQPELIELAFLVDGLVDNYEEYIDLILEKL